MSVGEQATGCYVLNAGNIIDTELAGYLSAGWVAKIRGGAFSWEMVLLMC